MAYEDDWVMGDLAAQNLPPPDEQQAVQDAFEAFAARTRRSVVPPEGRTEAPGQILGPVVHALTEPVRKGQGLLQTMRDYSAQEFPATYDATEQTTDYDARRAAADYAAGAGFNVITGGMGVAPEGALGMAGGRLRPEKATGFAPGSIAEIKLGKPIIDASGAPIKGAAFTKQSRAVLDEIAAGEKGAGPMDLSGTLRSDVPQVPMERYVPKHGVTDRLTDAIANKKVQQGVRESVETGLKFGADKWYHNEPVRREFIKELGEVRGPIEYARFMDMVAATSPRSDVPTNIRNASFYYQMSGKKGLPEELPYPYGHVAQNLHRQNYATVTSPEGWDIFKNTKPASFSANLQGNLVPGTMDTHAFRNIGMRTKDPRFLETSVSAKYKQGTDPTKDTIVNKYGERTGDTVVFRPQELHEGGKLKIKDALEIPYFWSAKPRANEYGAAEKFYSEVGRDFKLPTADAQGAAWAGGGQLTGLGTVPTHTFPQLLNERILYTAKMRGEDPSKTLSDFIRKKAPLLVVPVAGAVGAAKMGGIADQGEYQ
jgi:hypothetical protein